MVTRPSLSCPAVRRVAQHLLRWYPKPWRMRYSVEMRELVDEMPVRWRQVADLAVGAAREWMSPRAFGWPARSAAETIQFVRACKFFLGIVLLDIVARAVTARMADAHVTLPSVLGAAATPLFIVFCARAIAADAFEAAPSLRLTRHPWLSRIGHIELSFWLTVMFCLHIHNLAHVPRTSDPIVRMTFPYAFMLIWVQALFGATVRSRRLNRIVTAHRKRLIDARRATDRFW